MGGSDRSSQVWQANPTGGSERSNLASQARQVWIHCTAQKMKFSIKDFFSKCDQIRKCW